MLPRKFFWNHLGSVALGAMNGRCFVAVFLILTGCGSFQGTNSDRTAPGIGVESQTKNAQAVVSLSKNVRNAASYIVMFRQPRTHSNLYFASFNEEFSHHFQELAPKVLSDARIKAFDILTSVDMSASRATAWTADFAGPKSMTSIKSTESFEEGVPAGVMTKINFDSEASAADVLADWEKAGKLWYAEPNGISRFSSGELAQWGTAYASMQQWHQMIKLPDAFNALSQGGVSGAASEANMISSTPIIAVLDSGVDYQHPQLADNIWTNSQVGAAGCSNDVHGCNTTNPSKGSLGDGQVWPVSATGPGQSCGSSSSTDNKCDHGTHVAGIIAAKQISGSKVAGVCPFCQIMILRVGEVEPNDTSADPLIRDDSQIRAFKYLTRFKLNGDSAVRVVNASFGKYAQSRSLTILVDVLKKVGSGTVVIAAASNEDSMIRAYPAALDNAIAVASVGLVYGDGSVQKSSFSNFGSWVDIAAPGYIDSTISGGSHITMQGTSMAAPVVSGAAGLLLAAFPGLSFDDLRNRLLQTANAQTLYGLDTDGGKTNYQYYYPLVSGETVRRPLLGGGILDVNAMMNNNKKASTGQPIARVTAGCGVMGTGGAGHLGHFWLVAFFGAPIALSLLRRRGR